MKRMMQGQQHRNGAAHQEDDWCLQMLCQPTESFLARVEAEHCFGWNNHCLNPCDCPVDTCRVADWVEDVDHE